jgi:hypothetical protein
MKKETKFIPIQKSEGNKKNKYGIIPQNYNRSCQVAIEHNGSRLGGRFNAAKPLLWAVAVY